MKDSVPVTDIQTKFQSISMHTTCIAQSDMI